MLKFFNKIAVLLFLACLNLTGQELPPIENYSSKIYGAENQNWSIDQSNKKFIYIANNSGLLEFSGEKWRLYPSANNTVLRSVKCVNDRIYTGAYMEFGFWKKNNFGNLEYTSLSEKLKESLLEEDFWNIIDFESWVLFQSLNRIYVYNTQDETFKIITSDTQLPKVFKVENSIYFQKMEKGIFKIENGEAVLVSDNRVLKNNILVNIFKSNDKILYQTQNSGFYYLTESGIKKWNINADAVISTISVYSSVQLSNGSFILGTISNGIFQLDKNGNLVLHIDQEKGLNNNTVLSMVEDEDQNLWLGLDNGISVVNMNSPFRVFNDFKGKLGSVYTSAIFEDNLYLGTNQGLFYKKINSNNDFEFIKGTDGQVWCIKVFDNTLFCGHNKGTFVIENNKATLITDIMGTMEIKAVESNPNILVQGYYFGLNVIEKRNGTWRLRNKIAGFNPTSRFFDFTRDGDILVNHEYKGVFLLDVNNDLTQVKSYKILKSAPKTLKSAISNYNGDILYTSDKGIYKYNTEKKEFENDSILTNNFLKNDDFVSGRLVLDNESNTLWGFTNKTIVYFSPGKLNNTLQSNKIYLPAYLRNDIAGFESVIRLNNEVYLFGTSRGYILLNKEKLVDSDFVVSINLVEKSTLNEEKGFVPHENNIKFGAKENNLNFAYSVPKFDKFSPVYYQYQLIGLYDNWSDWSTESEISFKNLPHGSYTFNVNAKIGNNLSNNTASFSFVIKRPWYLSNNAILVYSLLFIVSLLIVHSLYKQHYSKQKKKLMDKKQREFSMSQLKSEKEIMRLKNEKLQNEIDSKTRELSSSTMNIIKKNEILNTIKGELSAVNDKDKIKPVIKIINKNLSNSSDWELFQEAFNNADSDFLKKLKNYTPT